MEKGSSHQQWSLPLRIYAFLLLFSFLGTAYSWKTGMNPGVVRPATGVITLLTSLYLVALPLFQQLPRWKAVFALLLLIGFGTLVEYYGVTSGFPFGSYVYTKEWWPTVALGSENNFPLLVGFAWAFAVLGAGSVVRYRSAILAGVVAAVIDLAMEYPAEKGFGYWWWMDYGTRIGRFVPSPPMNSIGWFGTATLAAGVITIGFKVVSDAPASREARIAVLLHVIFFLALFPLVAMYKR